MAELSDRELLAELGVSPEVAKKATLTAREERILAGFEDICRFYEEHGHVPQHGENHDIFERLYAVRLDRLRSLEECHALLTAHDTHGLLQTTEGVTKKKTTDMLDDKALLAELGVSSNPDAITTLRHVRSQAEIRAAEDIANREPCKDFESFKPLFEQIREDLKTGIRETRRFGREGGIRQGEFFILNGIIVYVAHIGDSVKKSYEGENYARLRLIYANGTESNLLLHSLQRALYKDDVGRRITDPTSGPLFGRMVEEDDQESGTIYVLKSLSDNPFIAKHRDLIHKIGVTGGDIKKRIANARHDATYLLADVEIVATYKLFNINRQKLEKLIHKILASARIDLEIKDRFGIPVEPKEWFLVPLAIISEIVNRISHNKLENVVYDPQHAKLIDL